MWRVVWRRELYVSIIPFILKSANCHLTYHAQTQTLQNSKITHQETKHKSQRTLRASLLTNEKQEQALTNLSAVLTAAGSSIDNVVKVNVFLTDMKDFAAMNEVYAKVFSKDPKPVRTCVAVHQLPLGTDVEIELTAHL